METTVSKLLALYRDLPQSEASRLFERLVRKVLQDLHSYWSRRFQKVVSWPEYARQNGLPAKDSGIDLVAYDQDGTLWGIQVKYWQEKSLLERPRVLPREPQGPRLSARTAGGALGGDEGSGKKLGKDRGHRPHRGSPPGRDRPRGPRSTKPGDSPPAGPAGPPPLPERGSGQGGGRPREGG